MKHKVKHIHFAGIGGVGMSGIAELLHTLGYTISGSDIAASPITKRLEKLGVKIFIGHASENIANADAIVISTAIPHDNPEVQLARKKHIPVVPRAQMLAELMRLKRGIAIAGTHGKTTTTSLVACILAEAGLDPTFVIGGKLNQADTNAKLGQSDFIVVEADESDASFLHLQPIVSVVTNIDADHMETYQNDMAKLKQTFVEFLHNLPFYGVAILCEDDPMVKEILPLISKQIMTYGINDHSHIQAHNVVHQQGRMHFDLIRTCMGEKTDPLHIELNLPGNHNVLNSLAAISVATEFGVEDSVICSALTNFRGVGRRFQQYGDVILSDGRHFKLVDDYGHHPAEVAATLSAARQAYPNRRIVLVFQPHRYTRTRDLFENFVQILSSADVLILGQVYSAGESPIPAADSKALSRAIRLAGKVDPIFAETINDMVDTSLNVIINNDLVITMGAGSVSQVPNLIMSNVMENTGILS